MEELEWRANSSRGIRIEAIKRNRVTTGSASPPMAVLINGRMI